MDGRMDAEVQRPDHRKSTCQFRDDRIWVDDAQNGLSGAHMANARMHS
jgi:hypothetical protein